MKQVLLLFALTIPAFAQTTVNVTTTPIHNGVLPIGTVIGGIGCYSTRQILKDLNYCNFGYLNAVEYQTSWYANTGGTLSPTNFFNAANFIGAYPANFWNGASYNLLSQSGGSISSGTITAQTANNGGSGANFTPSPAFSFTPVTGGNTTVQDVMLTSCRGYTQCPNSVAPVNAILPHISGTGSASWDTVNLDPHSANKTHTLQLTAGEQVQYFLDQLTPQAQNTVTTTQVNALNVNGTYTTKFDDWCASGPCAATWSVKRGTTTLASGTTTPTGTWAQRSINWTGTENGGQNDQLTYNIGCSTGDCRFADMTVIEGSTLAGNTTPFRDDYVRSLQNQGDKVVRCMDPANWASDVLSATLNIGGGIFATNSSPLNSTNFTAALPYGACLSLAQFLGGTAVISIGKNTTASDAAIWAEYLGGTCGTTGGAIRCSQAQSATWNSLFSATHAIVTEFGNEPWNTGAAGSIDSGNGIAYGVWTKSALAAFKSDPGYSATIDLTSVNGQAIHPQSDSNFGWDYEVLTTMGCTAANANCPTYIEHAPYIFNEYNSTTDVYTDEMVEGYNTSSTSIVGWQNMKNAQSYIHSTFGINTMIYEVSYSPTSGSASPTQAQVNNDTASVGTGLNICEFELGMIRDAGIYGPINNFAFVDQPYNVTVAGRVQSSWQDTQYLAAGPGQLGSWTDVFRPKYYCQQMINQAINATPNLVSCPQTGTPTLNYPGGQGGQVPANAAVPYVNTFCLTDGAGNFNVIAFNNNRSASESITITGNSPTGTVTATSMGGPTNLVTDNNALTNINNHGTAAPVVAPSPASLTGVTYSLGAGSINVFSFATGTPTAATPTFSVQSGTAPQYLTISDSTPASIIYYTTDGSAPTTSSSQYHVPLLIYPTQTVKAIAAAAGYLNSPPGNTSYTITAPTIRVSLMRNASSQTVTPTPLDDRMLPSSGVRWSDIFPTSGSAGVFTNYDAWVAAANANGSKVTFTAQARPTWMTGLAANTDGPSSDWNTPTACGTVGGMVLGTIKDCLWVTSDIKFFMHVTGLSTVPSSPVSCPNLDTLEASNESNTYSGSSSSVGFSGTPASLVQTMDDMAWVKAQWCTSQTKMLVGSFSSVVGSNGTSNPQYDVYAADILSLIPANYAGYYQGISIHMYPGRDNVIPVPPPTSNVSYSDAACTSGNTPNNSCYVPPATQVAQLKSVALLQAGNASWSGNWPVFITEGGYNKILNLNGDNTFGVAYISELIPLAAAQRAYNLMLYLGNDTSAGTPCPSFTANWGCYGVSPFNTATSQSITWQNSTTAVGTCTTSSITGGTMWTCPVTLASLGSAAIVWCAVQDPATCTTSTAFNTQQNINGTISSTGGTLTLSSTAELVYTVSAPPVTNVTVQGLVNAQGKVVIQ
jgi:hypothetical protein